MAYRLAEFLGSEAPVVQALAAAAESGDPDAAAEAWDLVLDLPAETRQGLATWMQAQQQSELPESIAVIFRSDPDD